MDIDFTIIAALIVTLALLVLLFIKLRKTPEPVKTVFSYERHSQLLSSEEIALFNTLEQALTDSYRVFCKVRLGDFISPAKGLSIEETMAAYEQINRHQLDYLICKHPENIIIGAIRLKKGPDSATTHDQLDNLFASVGIPLLSLPVRPRYRLLEVWSKLEETFRLSDKPAEPKKQPQTAAAVAPETAKTDQPLETEPSTALATSAINTPAANETIHIESPKADESVQLCPKCSAVMIKRQVAKGPHIGKHFLVCSNYPDCKQLLALKDEIQQPESPAKCEPVAAAEQETITVNPPSLTTEPKTDTDVIEGQTETSNLETEQEAEQAEPPTAEPSSNEDALESNEGIEAADESGIREEQPEPSTIEAVNPGDDHGEIGQTTAADNDQTGPDSESTVEEVEIENPETISVVDESDIKEEPLEPATTETAITDSNQTEIMTTEEPGNWDRQPEPATDETSVSSGKLPQFEAVDEHDIEEELPEHLTAAQPADDNHLAVVEAVDTDDSEAGQPETLTAEPSLDNDSQSEIEAAAESDKVEEHQESSTTEETAIDHNNNHDTEDINQTVATVEESTSEPEKEIEPQTVESKPAEPEKLTQPAAHVAEHETIECPKCSANMIKMQVKKGAHAGKYFWACSNHHACRHMMAIKE